MDFGLSNKWGYKRFSFLFLFLVPILLISLDTINRYLLVLEYGSLEESSTYTILRIFLFINLISFSLLEKRINIDWLFLVYFFLIVISIFSILINADSSVDFFKGVVYTSSFALIYRYGLVLGAEKKNFSFFVSFIIASLLILNAHYLYSFITKASLFAIVSNDAIFSVIVFMPFIFFIKRKAIIVLVVILIFITTILSQKRSVVVFGNICSIVGLLLLYLDRFNAKRAIVFFVYFLVLLGTISLSVLEIQENIFVTAIVKRFESSGDNGRNEIVDELLLNFSNGTFINNIFGFGFMGSTRIVGIPSHNDFLELLFDYGVFVCLLYFGGFLILIYRVIVLYKSKSFYLREYIVYVVSLFLLISLSTFNYMFFSLYNMILYFFLGFTYSRILSKNK